MTHYRLYFLDDYGGILHGLDLDCEDDAHAREMVRSHQTGAAMQLWQGARLVARFPAGGAQSKAD